MSVPTAWQHARVLPERVYRIIGDVATTAAFSRLHGTVYRALGGRLVDRALGCDIVLLGTRGRKTDRPHEVPLFAFHDGPRVVVIASRGGNDRPPAWYLNLLAHPDATLDFAGARRRVRARIAEGTERARLWRIAAAAYPGYETYRARTSREIPVVVLEDA